MKKIITFIVLPIIIVLLGYAIYASIESPVKFNKQKEKREAVAIQRLKDIRTLQVAFKSKFARFAPTVDSLIWFYNEGTILISKQIGSNDDSLAVDNTAKIKKKNPKITPEQMMALYEQGENLVFKIDKDVPVKDTLFNDRPNFVVDSLKLIPFCGEPVILNAAIKQVSGVDVPLFEACMPYKSLLVGIEPRQLIINIVAERNEQGRYPGLKVGSIDAPNNNAGNWE